MEKRETRDPALNESARDLGRRKLLQLLGAGCGALGTVGLVPKAWAAPRVAAPRILDLEIVDGQVGFNYQVPGKAVSDDTTFLHVRTWPDGEFYWSYSGSAPLSCLQPGGLVRHGSATGGHIDFPLWAESQCNGYTVPPGLPGEPYNGFVSIQISVGDRRSNELVARGDG